MPDRPPTPRPKTQSRPDLSADVDTVVGVARDYQASQEHVRPELARKGTLVGLGAVSPPGPPPLVRTVPAPSTTAATRRAPSPLGTPAQSQDEAVQEALRRRNEGLEAELAELRRRERVRLESQGPGPYQAPIESKRVPAPPATPSDSIAADGTLVSLRRAQTRFYLALAAALAAGSIPLASWLQNAAEAKAQSARADVKANAATSAADSAKQTAGNADKEIARLRAEFQQYRSNQREVLRLQGIEAPAHVGDPDANDLKPVTPYCPRGKVCSGPTLVLQVAP